VENGPPLGAFHLAPNQRENQGYSERNHDYGESQQIEHEHLPQLGRRLPAYGNTMTELRFRMV